MKSVNAFPMEERKAYSAHGLSKVELFAGMALQGLLSNCGPREIDVGRVAVLARRAAECLVYELEYVAPRPVVAQETPKT